MNASFPWFPMNCTWSGRLLWESREVEGTHVDYKQESWIFIRSSQGLSTLGTIVSLWEVSTMCHSRWDISSSGNISLPAVYELWFFGGSQTDLSQSWSDFLPQPCKEHMEKKIGKTRPLCLYLTHQSLLGLCLMYKIQYIWMHLHFDLKSNSVRYNTWAI